MKKAIIMVIACTMLFGILATGCGNNSDASKETTQVQSTAETKSETPVTIKFMHWWSYVTDDVLKPFKDENPNINIEMSYVSVDQYQNKLKLLASSSEVPDVMGMQNPILGEFIKQNKLMDLTEVLKEQAYDKTTPWGETISPVLMDSLKGMSPEEFKEKGKYGVPFGAIAVACVYNKNIYDKVGITAPKTWEEFLSNNDKLKAGGYIPMSFVGKVGWDTWWYRIGAALLMRDVKLDDFSTGKAKFTDPRYIEVLSTIQDMWSRGHFDPGGFTNGIEETQALFVQGKLATFLVVPENFVTYLIDNSPKEVKLDAFPLPAFKDKPNISIGGAANVISINNETKAKEASIKLAKYMVSEKMFQILAPMNVVPSTVGYKPPEGNPIMKAYADAVSFGFFNDNTPVATDSKLMDKMEKDLFTRLLLKNESPEKIAQELQEALEKNIKK